MASVTKRPSVLRSMVSDKYALWVLTLCSPAYINNQSNRYILGPIANKLEGGANFGNGTGDSVEYGMLTGPITTLPYCLGIAIFGPLADRTNKVRMFYMMIFWWAALFALMAAAKSYWLLSIIRALAIFGSSAAVSVGSGIVSDHFSNLSRGLALGISGFGVPVGIGLEFLIGNYVTSVTDYRVAILVCALWVVPVGFALMCTVKERDRSISMASEQTYQQQILRKLEKTCQSVSRISTMSM